MEHQATGSPYLVHFDSCFSGHGWNVGLIPKADTPPLQSLINTVSGNSSRYVLTAGSGKEKAYQIEVSTNNGYSIFTHELIKALRQNPAYFDPGICFDTLEQKAVPRKAKIEVAKFTGPHGIRMNPRCSRDRETKKYNGEFVCVTADARGAVLPSNIRQQFGIVPKVEADRAITISRTVPPNVGAMFSKFARIDAGGANALASGDFNGDGIPDLVAVNPTTGNIDVWMGEKDGTFRRAQSYPSGDTPYAIVAGDFNRDGRLDVAVTNVSWSGRAPSVTVFLGNGDGTFRKLQPIDAGVEPTGIVAADFDGDGNPDLAVSNRRSNSVNVLLGKGDGTFTQRVQYQVGNGNAFCLTTGDFNMDGIPDLAVGTTGTSDLSILLGKGNGSFATAKNYLTSPNVAHSVNTYSIAVADLNRDKKPDLALTRFGDDAVSVLLGNGDSTFPG